MWISTTDGTTPLDRGSRDHRQERWRRGFGRSAAALRGHPRRQRDLVAEQLVQGPGGVREACRQRGSALLSLPSAPPGCGHAETAVGPTEIGGAADQRPAGGQRLHLVR